MAKQYRITSRAGKDYGLYSGTNPTQALAALHRAAGYRVSAVDDQLQFPDEETRRICGDIKDWIVEEVADA